MFSQQDDPNIVPDLDSAASALKNDAFNEEAHFRRVFGSLFAQPEEKFMAASSWVLENKQEPFIAVMEALGYRSDRDGICHGVTYMCIPAYLVGDGKIFHKRLYIIQKIFFDALRNAKNELITIPEEKECKEFPKKILQKLLRKEINLIFNTLSMELQIDIKAFFEGVEIYHHPFFYNHLLPKSAAPAEQDAELSHELVESKKLKEEKGIKLLDTFGDGFLEVCSVIELSDSFEAMRSSFLSVKLAQPISLALHSFFSNHVISVIYYPHIQTWLMIDPSNLLQEEEKEVKIETKNPTEIAQQVVSAFSPSGRKAAFFTKIYSTGSSESIYRLPAQQWKEHQKLQFRRKSILEMKAEADTPRIFAIQALQKFAVRVGDIKSLIEKQDQLGSIGNYSQQIEVIEAMLPKSETRISVLKNKINQAYKVYVTSFDGKENKQFEKLLYNIQYEIGQLITPSPPISKFRFFSCCRKKSHVTHSKLSSKKLGISNELQDFYNLFVKDIGIFPLATALCNEMITRAGISFRS